MSTQKIFITEIELSKLNKSDLITISDLIYGTDDDIYSDVFGSKEVAREIIPNLINKTNCIFSSENILIARSDKEIVGVIVFSQNNSFSLGLSREDYKNLPDSFKNVNEIYFNGLADEYSNKPHLIYGFCVCVREDKRRENIGAMLLHRFIEEHGKTKDIYLDIVASNYPCIQLCTDKKNGFGFELYKTFLDYRKGGFMDLECNGLRRVRDMSL